MFDETASPAPEGGLAASTGATAAKFADPAWAWAPYQPDDQRPWSLPLAGHLFRRAAFGANWGQLQQALREGPQPTVDRLLHPEVDVAAFNRTYDQIESSTGGAGSADGLRAWWLRRMIETPHPLLEALTLFWHDHFAISNVKVNNAGLMARHVQTLRSYALGRYDGLLEALTEDPAVLAGLQSDANRKALPNPNLARALMECYVLGPGNFSETDVQEAARAFTGWFVLRDRLRYFPREHDDGPKKILGRQGNFAAKDVVRITLDQPAAPRLLVGKLYRWLICETAEPDDALVAPLARTFAKDYDVGKLVGTMLRSNLFFSEAAYRRRVKGPVEFALGIIRGLEGLVPTSRLGNDLADLGQNLGHPPTVKGWPGGRYWINGATLVGRSNLALALLSGAEPYGNRLDPLPVATKHGFTEAESAGRFLIDLFLQGDLNADVRRTLMAGLKETAEGTSGQLRRLAHSVFTLPEFQLA